MAKKYLTPEQRKWTHWVIDNLRKNKVGFIDLRKDQRISFGNSMIILDPKTLKLIPNHRGLVRRVNPRFKKKRS